MDNLLIAFESIGEGSLYVVDDETYDILFAIYENQEVGADGYSKMMEKFWTELRRIEAERGKEFPYRCLQWNSDDEFDEPITFKRVLQVLNE